MKWFRKKNIATSGEVVSVNLSKEKSLTKAPVESARFIEQSGMDGDIHSGGNNNRQVSFLNYERIQNHKFCPKLIKKNGQFLPGDFGENITVKGIDFLKLTFGNQIKIGTDVILEISKIGRNCCRKDCPINHRKKNGCFILREGMFGSVIKGGTINKGDPVSVY